MTDIQTVREGATTLLAEIKAVRRELATLEETIKQFARIQNPNAARQIKQMRAYASILSSTHNGGDEVENIHRELAALQRRLTATQSLHGDEWVNELNDIGRHVPGLRSRLALIAFGEDGPVSFSPVDERQSSKYAGRLSPN